MDERDKLYRDIILRASILNVKSGNALWCIMVEIIQQFANRRPIIMKQINNIYEYHSTYDLCLSNHPSPDLCFRYILQDYI